MVNLQEPEKPEHEQKAKVDIQDIYLTIQGEGPFHGEAAIFIRMAGCNFQCPGCDTDYTSTRTKMNPHEVVKKCQQIGKGYLVVLTGGEPFRQNITLMVKHLLRSGYRVQIETNGTLYLEGFPYHHLNVFIVCSPKAGINPKLPVDYYKYVIDADHVDETDGLPSSVLGLEGRPGRPFEDQWGNVPIYIQPMDSDDLEVTKKNISAAIDSVLKFRYRLCLQSHKLIGLP
jgi:7-carboxy-7-deazaguanine synthase